MKSGYLSIVIFVFLFFILAGIYKYVYFLIQLLRIKNKAIADPLRSIFTLRYFYYRLELELKKFNFHKDLFLVFIYLESFEAATGSMSLERIRNIWHGIRTAISIKGSFWSVYSPEALIGWIVSPPVKIYSKVTLLKESLEKVLQGKLVVSKVRLGCLKFKKEYLIRELPSLLWTEFKKRNDEILLFKDSDLASLLGPSYRQIKEGGELLKSFEEDIEDKNRQLLSLVEILNREHNKAKEAFFQIIASLVNALEARDPYTEGHSERVGKYALKMSERLGWGSEEKEKLKRAAFLHDLGNVGIPESILNKKSSLTDEEYAFIKRHSLIAVKILQPLEDLGEILTWILHHHERWNGSGYPYGLAGERIPLASQIIALSDTFDALTSNRPYRKSFSRDEAIKEIIRNKGMQFNPQLVDTFVEIITESQK